jgi:UDP-glucose 4-epimerase
VLTLCRLASLPIPLPFGALRNLRSLLSVENLIAAIIFLIEHREISNETFLVADPGPISLPEMITHLRSGMGKPPGLIACPAPLLQAAFQLFGLTKIWERIGGSLVVSADRFNKAGFRPAVSTADGLATMVRRG